METREKEILTLTGVNERYENFMQLTQSRMLPALTKKGFVVVQTPSRVQARLQSKLEDALRNINDLPDVPSVPLYYQTVPAKHIDLGQTLNDLYADLTNLHVSFVGGMDLTLMSVYGMRLDRAGAATAMHYEHVADRVISALVHVGSELDEPWPFEVEDHDGVIHAINLQPGQMIMYESAACLNGRRSVLKGKYWASVFLHYAPTDKMAWPYTLDDVVSNVPAHWGTGVSSQPGSRHAGQALTIDSLISPAAPPRTSAGTAPAAPTTAARSASAASASSTKSAAKETVISFTAPPSQQPGVYQSPYPWPWPGETEAWKEHMRKREQEIMLLPALDERWANFMLYTQGRMVPRFTKQGFKLLPIPPAVQARLLAEVHAGLARNDAEIRKEEDALGSYRTQPTDLIEMWPLLDKVHRDLKPLMEEWVGIELKPTIIYGVRVNRNGSALALHYDQIHTHVIAAIVHIDHEYYNNDEPWPIEIEDHDGVLHSFLLEPGQMLFYEAAACLHGRRQVLKGKYYASAFSHYQPVDRTIWDYTEQDVIAHMPKQWSEGVAEQTGSRYAGQTMTIDSLVADNAPPRVIRGERVDDIAQFWAKERKQEL